MHVFKFTYSILYCFKKSVLLALLVFCFLNEAKSQNDDFSCFNLNYRLAEWHNANKEYEKSCEIYDKLTFYSFHPRPRECLNAIDSYLKSSYGSKSNFYWSWAVLLGYDKAFLLEMFGLFPLKEKVYDSLRLKYFNDLDLKSIFTLQKLIGSDTYVRNNILKQLSNGEGILSHVDSINQIQIKKLISSENDLSYRTIGLETFELLIVLIMHVSYESEWEFYKKYMKKLLKKGIVPSNLYANVIDRYNRFKNKNNGVYGMQEYGSIHTKDGLIIKDVESVDKRRLEIGLLPLNMAHAEYTIRNLKLYKPIDETELFGNYCLK